ncbi:MAG TPA: hypothetical protein VJH03_00455 [Blastocatellia bacterium]|nr:hypothetical protein [Blastocatellia bacterium]
MFGTKLTTALVVATLLFSTAADVWCQPQAASSGTQPASTKQLKIKLEDLIKDIVAIKNGPAATLETRTRSRFDSTTLVTVFALALAAGPTAASFAQSIDDARVDKQVGGGASNSGSTSLVTKGSVPAILGFAVENGALSSDTSGTTITFRGNPVGIIKALGSRGFIKSYSDDTQFTRVLRRTSFALSFDAGRGPQPGTFTGEVSQLSSYSFRFDILNKRDPRHPSYAAQWSKFVLERGQTLLTNGQLLLDYFDESSGKSDPNLVAWFKAAQDAIVAASAANVGDIIKQEVLVKLPAVKVSPEVSALVSTYANEVNAYSQGRADILASVANGTILTFEYTNTRNVNDPDLSIFNLIIEASPWSGKASLTGNASFTILNKIPSGANLDRLRNYQLSGQLDVPLGEVQKIGSVVLTVAARFEHLMDDTMMPGGMMMDTRGNIGVGQVKLTLPVKGSGIKIPISVTFANRTELIKEKFVRGNFGVTFDLDSIFSRLNP